MYLNHQKKHFLLIIFTLILLLFSLSQCTSVKEKKIGQVFRYNEFANITSLDPAFARNLSNIWATTQLFNGLVQLDDSLNVTPDIAEEWSVSNDGLNYKFSLRDNVYFHQSIAFGDVRTRKVVATDFVYSLNRLRDPKVASPGGWVLQNVDEIKALNEYELNIKLKKPFPAFLGLLTMEYCSVVPREVIEKVNEKFRNQPIGTGPFHFKKWEEDVKLVLRKNPNYFEKDNQGVSLPYLEAIAITFIPDIQSEFMLFIQGKLDLLNSLDNSYKDELLTSNGDLRESYKTKINMQTGPYLNTEYIGFYLDTKSEAIRSKLVREAINLGFDRKKMIAYLRNNIGFIGNRGLIPRGLPGHGANTSIQYDPIKASNLINKFKNKHGFIPQITLATDANYLDICEYLQRALEKIGLKIKVDVMTPALLKQSRSSGKLEMFRASWIADYPDAENYLSLFYSKNFSPNGPNYTHYQNEEFDALYQNSFEINNLQLSKENYKKMDSIAMNEYPIVPLYYDQVIRFVQKGISGLTINPINILKLKKVKKR
jgi:peptide/nickel transport system substrate-binding protein